MCLAELPSFLGNFRVVIQLPPLELPPTLVSPGYPWGNQRLICVAGPVT